MQTESEIKDELERKIIDRLIHSNLSIDASDIMVSVLSTTVTLTGTVNSEYQKEEAGRIAWNTEGIWFVTNLLSVDNCYDVVG